MPCTIMHSYLCSHICGGFHLKPSSCVADKVSKEKLQGKIKSRLYSFQSVLSVTPLLCLSRTRNFSGSTSTLQKPKLWLI